MNRSNFSVDLSEEVIKVEEAKKPSLNNIHQHKGSIASALSPHDNVDLLQDVFGVYYDDNGDSHDIQRFTWRNKNKIQVQVINYGARITSIRMPDRKGSIDDIVLGFDDIAGYVHYKNIYLGATIGRMSHTVKNSTFVINNKQYWVTPNRPPHHYNGGRYGFDQMVWTTFVDDKKVIMSHISPHMNEGYPGDLLVRIIFELSPRNEFLIRIEAQCTQATIINISNLTYFNLAGHHSGSQELYRHMTTLNCNCFTPQNDNMPTGTILNVVHTNFDFQIPRILGKLMGISPKDGYNQNMCINRGMNQDDCFVARVLHPPSGRMVEMYSNQMGVNFSTANDFGYDNVLSMEQIISPPAAKPAKTEGTEPLLRLYEKVHVQMQNTMEVKDETIFKEIYDLVKKIKEFDIANAPNNTPAEPADNIVEEDEFFRQHKNLKPENFSFTQLQLDYLNNILKILCDKQDEDECEELKDIIKVILCHVKVSDPIVKDSEEKKETKNHDKASNGEEKDNLAQNRSDKSEVKIEEKKSDSKKRSTTSNLGKKKKRNFIPEYYRCTNKVIGKDRAHYMTHSGMALQTQNYPACANFKNFPNCVLKPGETYVHTITYKFWIRAGNPNRWIKRNLSDPKSTKTD